MTTTIDACASGAAGVRPLLSAGRRVVVDGHAICAQCGAAVEPVGGDEWRHGVSRRPRIDPEARSYEDFTRRFPWLAASAADWRGAAAIFKDYKKSLRAAARRRALRAGDNPYLELFRLLSAGPSRLLDLPERRRELASLFSWAIPTEAALDALARYAPLVECGAGMGYWLALLEARGIDAIGYDSASPGGDNAYHRRSRAPWTTVARASSAEAARRHRDRALVLCWPPYDDDAASYAALRAYRGEVVVHIGEPGEGATGSVRFHRELALNWTLVEELDLPRWPRLQDRLMVYRRNPVRRPHVERDRCFECRRFIPTGAIGRCDACFVERPPALALRVGRHRVEYPQQVLDTMPHALRKAFEASPSRIR